MHSLKLSEITQAAIDAAIAAGKILCKGFGTSFAIASKPGIQNLVTEYDKAAEECIISLLLNRFPDHSILAEESGSDQKQEAPIRWIIDPLDGTVNFAHNLPFFSVSIAACQEDQVISAVVYQPLLNELFVAEKNRGAYLNAKRLNVSTTTQLDKAIMATGFPYDIDRNPLHCIDILAYMLKKGVPIRRLGSAALDLAYVAAGRFDAYWEVSLQPWDAAAGKLLVEEAGGKLTHWDNTPRPVLSETTILATNGRMHAALVAHLNAGMHTS